MLKPKSKAIDAHTESNNCLTFFKRSLRISPKVGGYQGSPNAYTVRNNNLRRTLTMPLTHAGQLAPVDKADLIPASAGDSRPNTIYRSGVQPCCAAEMEKPEKYVCQIFTSAGRNKSDVLAASPALRCQRQRTLRRRTSSPEQPEDRSDAVVPGAPAENFTAMQR